MKKCLLGGLAGALVLAVNMVSAPAYAFHCPILVKECLATVESIAKRPGSDQKMLAEAKQGCDDALKLHQAGNHKASVEKVGEAITMAGKAAK
jgi:hypothetical protein